MAVAVAVAAPAGESKLRVSLCCLSSMTPPAALAHAVMACARVRNCKMAYDSVLLPVPLLVVVKVDTSTFCGAAPHCVTSRGVVRR